MEHLFTSLNHAVEGAPLVALGAAALWGVLSIVLSPCHLASIPLIVGFISGQGRVSTGRASALATLFAVGILITIAAIGAATAAAGRMMGDLGRWGNYFVAAIFLVVGLHLLGVIPVSWSGSGQVGMKRKGLVAAFVLGLVFGLALGPCTFAFMAPVLAVAFKLAATSFLYAAALLLAYGVGHCSVIVAAGTSTELVQRFLNWNEQSKGLKTVKGVCGVMVLFGGLWLIYSAPAGSERAARASTVKLSAPQGAPEVMRIQAQVVAFYFHRTVRCETCLKIEKEAREFIGRRFAAEITAGLVAFKAVNYDLAENAHFATDYRLPCPSLVLVRQEDGKDQDWKLLGQTWELIQFPPRLHEYIEAEITNFFGVTREPSADGERAETAAAKTVDSFAQVEELAREMNAVLVFLPPAGGEPPAGEWVGINGAKRTLEARFGINVGCFSLAPGSRDYDEMRVKTSLPAVVAIVKTGTRRVIAGKLTEDKVVEGFMNAVAAGGCCPLGYPGEK